MANPDVRKDGVYRFRWLSAGRMPPAFDLRQFGWVLEEGSDPSASCIALVDAAEAGSDPWRMAKIFPEDLRRFIVVLGAIAPQERTGLLQAGFGDALTHDIESTEFEARVTRLAELTRWLPRHRRIGDLELDLLAREAYGHRKALNLNPREFALIWRLADTPGIPVSKQDLIHDVWRMGFVPETNSIAVHISRLRRKLGFVGMAGMIATATAGGYCLVGATPRAAVGRTSDIMVPRALVASAVHPQPTAF